jgi:hypothetical protein
MLERGSRQATDGNAFQIKKQNQNQHIYMSNPKKELTQEELEKIAGGKRGTPGSSSTTGRQTSTYTGPGRPKAPVHHRTSSSTN